METQKHFRVVWVDGQPLICRDVGCQDFQAAEANRARVAQGKEGGWWDWWENSIDATPDRNLPLADITCPCHAPGYESEKDHQGQAIDLEEEFKEEERNV